MRVAANSVETNASMLVSPVRDGSWREQNLHFRTCRKDGVRPNIRPKPDRKPSTTNPDVKADKLILGTKVMAPYKRREQEELVCFYGVTKTRCGG